VGIYGLTINAATGGYELQKAQTHHASARKLVAVATVGLALVAASPAQAADTTAADNQYGAVLGHQSGGAGPGGLPFTGLNLVVVTGLGAGLVAAGVGLRSASRRPHES
jgi:hypothetical protein